MKILYVDPISPKGHKNFNYGLLRCLTSINNIDVDVLIRKNYIDFDGKNISVNKVEYINEKHIPENVLKNSKNLMEYRVKMRWNQYIFLKGLFHSIKDKDYDLILFTCIDLVSFSIASYHIKQRCVFIDHGISDLPESNFKKFFWKNINSKFEAVLMEEYVEKYVKNIIKAKNKTWLIHHTLPVIETNILDNYTNFTDKYIIYAPGESNDEKFIEDLIKISSYIPDTFKIIIKSKKTTFDSDTLFVYNRRLNDIEYFGLMDKSTYVLLPYESNYNYKTSGVFFEAVFFNKPVMLHANNTLVYYKEKFPNIIECFNDLKNMLELLHNTVIKKVNKEEFVNISYEYSDEKIKEQIQNMLMNNKE